jgi:hypothetical protein
LRVIHLLSLPTICFWFWLLCPKSVLG